MNTFTQSRPATLVKPMGPSSEPAQKGLPVWLMTFSLSQNKISSGNEQRTVLGIREDNLVQRVPPAVVVQA